MAIYTITTGGGHSFAPLRGNGWPVSRSRCGSIPSCLLQC